MILNSDIIKGIEKLVQEIRKENGIKNEIIRDDVFSILQAQDCTVLYYPLFSEENEAVDDESIGCDGCHLEKPVNERIEQFVFINTHNTRERQAFSVAHELGHIWKVDKRLKELLPDEIIDAEPVVNRFAAELLMPQKLFIEHTDEWLRKENCNGPTIKVMDLIRLIAYLMNEYFVPFKAIVKRFNEVGRLKEESNDLILKYKNSALLDEIIKAEQYTRLNIVTDLRSMDNLPEYLQRAEILGIFNKTKIKNIRKDFEIKEVGETSNDDVFFGQ